MALEITLAGEVTVRAGAGGDTVGLSSARARVAFAMLTLERQQGVTRDVLAEAVWPHRLPRTWDSALRTVVSEVRSFVAQALPPGRDPLLALTGRYRLQLPGDVAVDVEQAEQALAAAQDALAGGDDPVAWRLAQQAAGVLRAPFLPDHDADWVTAQQERLGRLLVAALETASQAAAGQGDGAGALSAAEEAIRRAPLRESAHRCRMAAHLAAGNRADALRAYQELRRVLADELGTDPSPETEAAYLALLGAVPTAPVPRAEQPAPADAAPVTATASMPLVGRDAELDRLDQAWRAATGQHACHVALVTGDVGIGKTRLVVETAHRANRQGGLVLLSRCERDAVVPYQPFVELLDGFAATFADEGLPRLDGLARAELAAVFPSFRAVAGTADDGPAGRPPAAPGGGARADRAKARAATPSTPATGPPATGDRARLFDAVADVLLAATTDRPVAVVLDDLHWAATDTQLLLRHLLARAAEAPLLVVAVARDLAQLARPLADGFRSLDRAGRLHRVPLDGLQEADVRALVDQTLPTSGGETERLTRTLLSDTSGNPFMLTELLRGHRIPGTAGAPGGDRLDRSTAAEPRAGPQEAASDPRSAARIPPALEDLVTDMLAGLDRPATELLRGAAVAGTTFEPDLVAATVGLDELAALDALDVALAARLVREVPTRLADPREPGFRFTHEIVQRTLYHQLATPRRRRLHARLADAIEAQRDDRLDRYTPLLARHRSAAAGPSGDHRAVEWSRAAGRQAHQHRATSEALRLYEQALQHVPPDDAALRVEVLGELGMAQVAADDPAGERSLLDASLQARSCGRVDVAAWTCLCVADLARHRPDLRATAASLVADVLRDIDTAARRSTGQPGGDVPLGAPTRPRQPDSDRDAPPVDRLVHARLLAQHVQLADGAAAAGPGPSGPLPSSLAGETAGRALDVLRDHLLILGGPDQLDERRRHADDLLALADTAGDPLHRAVAAHHHAMLRAITAGGPALAPPLPEGPGSELLLAEHELAVAVTQGRFDHAEAAAERLTATLPGDETPLTRGITPAPGTVAAHQMLVGLWLRRALELDGIELAPDPEATDELLAKLSSETAPPNPAEQALLAIIHGDLGAARLTVRAVTTGTQSLSQGELWLHAAGVLGLVTVELDDPTLAAAVHDMLAPYAGLSCGVGYRSFAGATSFHLGRLAAVAGDHAEAERHLAAALQEHTDAGARPWIALTQQAQADVLDARGRSPDRDWIAALRAESRTIVRSLQP